MAYCMELSIIGGDVAQNKRFNLPKTTIGWYVTGLQTLNIFFDDTIQHDKIIELIEKINSELKLQFVAADKQIFLYLPSMKEKNIAIEILQFN